MSTGKGGGSRAAEGPSTREMFRELEETVRELEREDVPLERAMALFERGVELSRLLAQRLEQAEQKVYRLVAEAGGGFGITPLSLADERGADAGDDAASGGEEEGEGDGSPSGRVPPRGQ